MNRMPEIDHTFTTEIVCPYCGYKYRDSCEFADDDEEDCAECGKTFKFVREVSVTYSTEKITIDSQKRKKS